MTRFVALLRGINVGGKHKLPMKDLVAIFGDLGCQDVASYIQSGNVVFGAAPALAARIPELVAKAVGRLFGFHVPILVCSAAELRRVAGGNPFVRAGGDPTTLHVVFLADAPPAAKVTTLDPKRSPPDEFRVRGRAIYLHCPNGYGRSKLTNDYFESKLGTTSTVRNWRTVGTLLDMLGG